MRNYIILRRDGENIICEGSRNTELGTPLAGSAGVFARWMWDGKTLSADNDALGMMPLYYAKGKDWIAISASIPELLNHGVPADLDYDSLAAFLHFGLYIKDSTPFMQIRAFPPGAHLRWSLEKFSLSSSPLNPTNLDLNRSQAVEAYITLFRDSMKRNLEICEEFIILLTAGRDSRHILYEALKQGRKPSYTLTANHLPLRPNGDAPIAALVSNKLEIPHTTVGPADSYVKTEYEKFETLGWLSLEHIFAGPIVDYLSKSPNTVFEGTGIDSYLAPAFVKEDQFRLFESGKLDELINEFRIYKEEEIPWLTSFLKKELTFERAAALIIPELLNYEKHPNPLGSFLFWNRTRRNIALAPFSLFEITGSRVLAPYSELSLLSFVMSIPATLLFDGKFRDDALAKAYPEYSSLPFEKHGSPSPKLNWGFHAKAVRQYLEILRNGQSRFLSTTYIIPRLAAVLLTFRGAVNYRWWINHTLYMCSLERFLDKTKMPKLSNLVGPE